MRYLLGSILAVTFLALAGCTQSSYRDNLSRGLELKQTGQIEAARAEFDVMMESVPSEPLALDAAAFALLSQNEGDNMPEAQYALRLATQACAMTDFQQAGLLDTLARAYMQNLDPAKAITYQQKAAALAVGDRAEIYRWKVAYYRVDASVAAGSDEPMADDHLAYLSRSARSKKAGDTESAAKDLERMMELVPQEPGKLDDVAWAMIASKSEFYLNPGLALKLSTQACAMTDYSQAGMLDTLAAAYAEHGQFEKAVDIQQKAVQLAQGPDVEVFSKNLAKYRNGKPWREVTATDTHTN